MQARQFTLPSLSQPIGSSQHFPNRLGQASPTRQAHNFLIGDTFKESRGRPARPRYTFPAGPRP
eukprot:12403377-Heterocapsa_arctica.AAC.1